MFFPNFKELLSLFIKVYGSEKIYRNEVAFTDYGRETYRRIKQQILDKTAHFAFDEMAYEMISKEAYEVLPNQMKPRLVFIHLVETLRSKRIELPSV